MNSNLKCTNRNIRLITDFEKGIITISRSKYTKERFLKQNISSKNVCRLNTQDQGFLFSLRAKLDKVCEIINQHNVKANNKMLRTILKLSIASCPLPFVLLYENFDAVINCTRIFLKKNWISKLFEKILTVQNFQVNYDNKKTLVKFNSTNIYRLRNKKNPPLYAVFTRPIAKPKRGLMQLSVP